MNIKGNRIETGMILLGTDPETAAAMVAAGLDAPSNTEILEIGINGKRHRIATVRRDGVTFTMRFDPRETYLVQD